MGIQIPCVLDWTRVESVESGGREGGNIDLSSLHLMEAMEAIVRTSGALNSLQPRLPLIY